MAYITELHYCHICGIYLSPDNGDAICSGCEDEMIECSKCGDFHMPDWNCQKEIQVNWIEEQEIQMDTNSFLVKVSAESQTGRIENVMVTVNHDKGKKSIVVSYAPALNQGASIIISQMHFKNIAPMLRFNRTKVVAEIERAQQEIANKQGLCYEGLVEMLGKFGYKLVAT